MKANPLQTVLMLMALGALWGASYLFMRVVGPQLGAPVTAMVRFSLAATALLLYAFAIGNRPNFRAHWQKFLILGLLNNVIPQTLIVNSVVNLNASLPAILNAVTPLFTAIIAAIYLRESFGWQKSAGALLGITGVGILMGFSPVPINPQTIAATLEALLAALSYGLAAVYARKAFKGIQPLHIAVGQLCASSLLILPLALPTMRPVTLTPVLLGSVLGLALLSTSVAYLLYFRLVISAGATAATSVTFLIPLFSLLWGGLFLREPFSLGMFVGLTTILLSVWLILRA